jgi:hypothetical protein
MNKLTEIFQAWVAAANPTPEQQLIAEHRASICDTCSYKGYIAAMDTYVCKECGCPLSKKVFSPLPGPQSCPKKFWTK